MKNRVVFVLFTFFATICWQCSEKNPVGISAYSPDRPSGKPTIAVGNLKTGNNYSTGYGNGNIRSDRVTLDWTTVTDADFLCYKIYRKPAVQGWYNPNPIATFTTSTKSRYTDTGLFQDTEYDYKIAVLNKSGLYRTDEVRVKTPRFLAPDDVTLTLSTPPDSSITIEWSNRAESATMFEVRRSEDNNTYTALVNVSDTFYVDRTARRFTGYYYIVRAYNSYESTTYSVFEYVYNN